MERTQTRQGKVFDARWRGVVLRHIEEYQVKFVAVTTTEYTAVNYLRTSYQNNYEHLWSKRYHSRNVTQSQTIRGGVKMGQLLCAGGFNPSDPPTNTALDKRTKIYTDRIKSELLLDRLSVYAKRPH